MAAGIGSVTSTPNIAGNRQFRSYLNQSMATSGRTPSAATLDQIIQGELDAQARRVAEQQRFGLEERRLAESGRQFDIGQQTARDIAERGQTAGLVQAGMGLGTTAATLRALTMEKGAPFFGSLFGGGKALTTGGIGKAGMEAGKGLFAGGGVPAFSEVPALTQTAASMVEPTLTTAANTALTSTAVPAATTGAATLAGQGLSEFAGMSPSAIDAAILTGGTEAATAPAAAGLGFSSVALPLAAYEGMRFLGDNVVGGTLGDFLKKPLTGVGSYGLSKLGDITGVRELGHAGKFLVDVEETLIQKPIDAVTGAIGNVISEISGWF